MSIKNNCQSPYCSKLVSDWSRYPNNEAHTLAYVTIRKNLFDPIQDSDLMDFNQRRDQEEEIDKQMEMLFFGDN